MEKRGRPSTMNAPTTIVFTAPAELLTRLEALSARTGISRAKFLRLALEAALVKYENLPTLE